MDNQEEVMRKKIKFGPEIFYGDKPHAVPYVQLSPLDDQIVASYTGPGSGLAFAEGHLENSYFANLVAGVRDWNLREEQAYGISLSLYEQNPVSRKISGEPIADSFALCVRRNSAILMVADGVNWGDKSRLAARCALYGSMKYLNYKIFERKRKPENTQDVVQLLRKALDEAHRAIIAKAGGLTTLCLCMVCEVDNSDQHAVCCVNVGDSLAFIYSANQNIREVTIGSHDVGSERDIRDAGGALGPVNGVDPELHNLTCSVTFCDKGDIIFLTTDGISDNFDPVVTKIALPMRSNNSNSNFIENCDSNRSIVIKPELTPKERHVYALKEMEKVIHEFELATEERCSAQSFCGALVQHVLTLTDQKRKIAENSVIYAKNKMTKEDRQAKKSETAEKMSKAPGKLDHASIVAVEVGAFTKTAPGDDFRVPQGYEVSDQLIRAASEPRNISEPPPTPEHLPLCGSLSLSPPNQHSLKSGARKFFSKLRSLPSSPTSTEPPALSSSVPNEPFRSFSAPLTHPRLVLSSSFTNCAQESSTTNSSKSSNQDVQKSFDMPFPHYKFPKRRHSKTSELCTPTSNTIIESPMEFDDIRLPPSHCGQSHNNIRQLRAF